MKKINVLLIFISFLSFATIAHAQQKEEKLRSKYINFSFIDSKMEFDDDESTPKLSSNYGAAFSVGKTYYLHKKPILGILRFGIDATWLDLNYTNYSIKSEYEYDDDYGYYDDDERSSKEDCHQIEAGMQVGPSITITPIGKLNVHTYFRYAPSFSGLYLDDNFYGNYASFFVCGAAISYGAIGLGVESRWGSCKYKDFSDSDDDDYSYGYSDEKTSTDFKRTYSGLRAYISIRF